MAGVTNYQIAKRRYGGSICTPKEFGARLGAYLYWNKISVENLEELGVASDTIHRWMAGTRFPHPDDLERLSNATGVNVDELFAPVTRGAVKHALDHTYKGRYVIFSPEKVCAIQDELGLSSAEAARRCHFHGTNFFTRLRRGETKYAKRETLETVAKVFGVALEDLL